MDILYAMLSFIGTSLFSLMYLLMVVIYHKQNPYPLVSVTIFASKTSTVKILAKSIWEVSMVLLLLVLLLLVLSLVLLSAVMFIFVTKHFLS